MYAVYCIIYTFTSVLCALRCVLIILVFNSYGIFCDISIIIVNFNNVMDIQNFTLF